MSSLSALRRATNVSTITVKPPPVTEVPTQTNGYVYPIYTESEMVMVNRLKGEAEIYTRYTPEGWFNTLVEGERFVGVMALEGCMDPLEAVCDHWLIAIETGKTFKDRAFYSDKALMLAYSLEASGHITMPIAKYYIDKALKSDIAVGISLIRIKEVVQDFQIALNENRPVEL